MPRFALAATTLACTLAFAAPPAHARAMPAMGVDEHGAMYHRNSYRGAPDLNLTLAMVIAGGGPRKFSSAKLISVLAGPLTGAEVAKLTKQYGAANVKSFLATFDYAVDDVLRLVTVRHIPLPTKPIPNPHDGGKMSAALLHAGTMPNGRFDVGYMLEHLMSHNLHVVLMKDINDNPRFGPQVNANLHIILTTALLDLKSAYGL